MKKPILLLVLLLFGTLTVGCVTLNQHLTVNSDDTAEVRIELILPAQLWNLARSSGDMNPAQMSAQIQAEIEGATVEEITDGGNGGIAIVIPFESTDDAIAFLEEGKGLEGLSEASAPSSNIVSDISLTTSGSFWSRATTVTVTTDAEALAEFQSSLGELDEGEQVLEMSPDQLFTLRFGITLPEAIQDPGGGSLSNDDHTVTWTLPTDQPTTLTATTQPQRPTAIWILIGAVVLLAVGGVVFFLRG